MDFLKLNYIGSVLEHGQRREAFFDGMHQLCGQFFAADNVIRNCSVKKSKRVLDVPEETLMRAPFETPLIPETDPALKAYDEILRRGGANLPVRDVITTYVSESVRNDSGRPAGKTDDWPSAGFASYKPSTAAADSDKDGMPDEWELRYKLNPQDSSDGSIDSDGDGYTNIEEFINGTNPREFVDYRDPANNREVREAQLVK